MNIFIPIKENSQRVPNKNFRLLEGVTLYKRALYKLYNHNVYVDTDSNYILEEISSDLHLKNYINSYSRPQNLRGDKVSVCKLIDNFIKTHNINGPICQLHVTSPFLNIETVEEALTKISEGYDSVVSCSKVNSRFWKKEDYGYVPVNHNPLRLEQTQDLPTLYEENSAFYIFDSTLFTKTGNRIGTNPYFFPVNFPENIDIDTEDDWNLVEKIL